MIGIILRLIISGYAIKNIQLFLTDTVIILMKEKDLILLEIFELNKANLDI